MSRRVSRRAKLGELLERTQHDDMLWELDRPEDHEFVADMERLVADWRAGRPLRPEDRDTVMYRLLEYELPVKAGRQVGWSPTSKAQARRYVSYLVEYGTQDYLHHHGRQRLSNRDRDELYRFAIERMEERCPELRGKVTSPRGAIEAGDIRKYRAPDSSDEWDWDFQAIFPDPKQLMARWWERRSPKRR
jgi:hypothetical protein